MGSASRAFAVIALVPLLTGCAGGWRGGSPPPEWATAAAPAAVTAAPSAPGTPGGDATGTHATADGAVFVWKGEGSSVNVAGDFNAWSASADALAKQTDGSWRIEQKLPPGRYAYKFVIDANSWRPDPASAEGVDDGFGGKNSLVVVGGASAAVVTAPPAAAIPAAALAVAAGAGPSVTSAGVVFTYAGAANTVHLAGEFNAWSTSADPLTKGADGTFSITKALPPGRHAYKFVIDGTNWKPDPAAAESVDDGFGGKNSLVVVGESAAGAAAPAAPAVAVAATGAAAVLPLAAGAKPAPPLVTAAGVVFTYAGPAKAGVALSGDFNSWATTADMMTQAADGTWTITKTLAAGTYGYKFLVDGGTWKQDDGNPQSKDDGFGGKNSVVVVN